MLILHTTQKGKVLRGKSEESSPVVYPLNRRPRPGRVKMVRDGKIFDYSEVAPQSTPKLTPKQMILKSEIYKESRLFLKAKVCASAY